MRPATLALQARIVAMAREGLTPTLIAERLNGAASVGMVRVLLCYARRDDPTVPKFCLGRQPTDIPSRAEQMARDGLRPSEIARKIGCSPTYISRVLGWARARGDRTVPKFSEGRPREAPPPSQALRQRPEGLSETVRGLAVRGFSPTQIAAKLRLPYREIDRELHQ